MLNIKYKLLGRICAMLVLLMLTPGTCAELADQVLNDVQTHPNHITQLQQFTANYLKEQENPRFSEAVFPLLLGARGLAKTPAQLSQITPERRQAQKKWALEFILRYTHQQYDGEKLSPETSKVMPFLTQVVTTFAGVDTSDINIDHIAYCCVLSLAFQWTIDQELYTFPTYTEPQLAFLRAESTYAKLQAHSSDLHKQVHAKVSEKLTDQNALDAFLQKSAYAQIAPALINYLKVPVISMSPHIPGYKHSLEADYEHPVDTSLQGIPENPAKKQFHGKLKGTINGVPGDGTCYFHTLRDLRQTVAKWEKEEEERKSISRSFVAAEIEQHLNNPLIRFWLSKEAVLHIEEYITLTNPFKWLETFEEGRKFVELTQRKKQKANLTAEKRSKQNQIDELSKAGVLPAADKARLEKEIAALTAQIANITSTNDAQATQNLATAKAQLQDWVYTKEGSSTYLKEVIKGTNQWAITGTLLNTILAYLYGLDFYLFQSKGSILQLTNKIRVSPTTQQHGIVHHTNHFMWIRDMQLTATDITAGAS